MAAMRTLAISALPLAGRTDITEATRWAAGPCTGHLPSSASPDRVARGDRRGRKGVLLAVLTAAKPSCRPRRRPIYRAHVGRMRGNDRRNGLTETDIAYLRLPVCH